MLHPSQSINRVSSAPIAFVIASRSPVAVAGARSTPSTRSRPRRTSSVVAMRGIRYLRPTATKRWRALSQFECRSELEGSVPAIRRHFVDTLAYPTTIAVDASEMRAHTATRANVLSSALDAAVSAGAKNSLERPREPAAADRNRLAAQARVASCRGKQRG